MKINLSELKVGNYIRYKYRNKPELVETIDTIRDQKNILRYRINRSEHWYYENGYYLPLSGHSRDIVEIIEQVEKLQVAK